MSEATLTKRVGEYLKTIPHSLFWKVHQSGFGRAGVSDYVGCVRGRFCAIELKAPGKYIAPFVGLRKAQLAFMDDVRDSDGFYLVADSLETVKDFMAGVLSVVEVQEEYT